LTSDKIHVVPREQLQDGAGEIMKNILFLGYTPADDSEGNVGDTVINSGVFNIFSGIFAMNASWHDRATPSIEGTPGEIDVLVYAGMPQFGARTEPTLEEKIWRSLLEKYPAAVSYDVGCGTGYSCLHNRLCIAALMASTNFNQYYYGQQTKVQFLPRDPLSLHFLELCGCNAKLMLCPSAFSGSCNADPEHSLALIIATPDNKLNIDEKEKLGFSLTDLYAEIIGRYPDALCIGQEHEDWAIIEKIGAKNAMVANTTEQFMAVCASAQKVISFRVHGTVASLLAGCTVLHYAIDGRSDLLTPYMTSGLTKKNLFQSDMSSHLSDIETFSKTEGKTDIGPLMDRARVCLIEAIKAPRRNANGHNLFKSLTINADKVSMMGIGSVCIFTNKAFASNALTQSDRSLQGTVVGEGETLFYGLYKAFPTGVYKVRFDLEFWGALTADDDCEIVFETVSAGAIVERCVVMLSALLTSERLVATTFANRTDGAVIEFRASAAKTIPTLTVEFFGVCIERFG
jgi:Polysaccharide pyruvyl transferase